MSKPKGKSLDAFKAIHCKKHVRDERIREGLKALGESWLYELEFMRLCRLRHAAFSGAREVFPGYWFETAAGSKRIWAGCPKFAAKLKEAMR